MIIKLLNDIILKEDKKKRDESLGVGITGWRSSGLGTCMRGRYLDRLLSGTGLKPEHDPRTLRIFEMGNQVEKWLMDSLNKQDEYTVEAQGEMYDPELNLTGHFDAVLCEKTEPYKAIMIECKSKNSNGFKYLKGDAQIHHKMQLHSYLYMINKYGYTSPDGTKGSYSNLKEGKVLYVSKDDMMLGEYSVFLNDVELEKMWKYEIETLNKCWNDKTAPPAPEKGSWQEKYCKFCEAGVCKDLDDAMVKGLWEDKEKELIETELQWTVTSPIEITPSTSTLTEEMVKKAVDMLKAQSGFSTSAIAPAPVSESTLASVMPVKRTKYKFKKGDRVMNVIAEQGTVHERLGANGYGVAWDKRVGLTVEHEDNLIKCPF